MAAGGGGGAGIFPTGLGALGREGIANSASFGLNQIAASDAWDTYKKSLKRGPTYMMQGLAKAGINPILAAGGGINAAGQGRAVQQAATNAKGPTTSTAVGQSRLMGSQVKATDAMTTKTQNEADLVKQRKVLEAAGLPAAQFKVQFDTSPEGIELMRQQRINEAMPTTLPAAGARGLWNLWQTERKTPWNTQFNRQDPKGKHIMPRDSRK